MYCYNCGKTVPEQSKFCLHCGTNIEIYKVNNNVGNIKSNNEKTNVVHDVNNQQIEDEYCRENRDKERCEYIFCVFADIFENDKQFGNQVYMVGRTPISREIKENLEKIYLNGCGYDEIPLMLFDYDNKSLKMGFVLTNQRIIWNYDNPAKIQDIYLDDIKEIQVHKRVLASVMCLIDFNFIQYPDIYLTGIDSKELFVAKLKKLINKINSEFYDMDEKDLTNVDKISQICNSVDINSMYCEIGNPISISSKKNESARRYFGIPADDDVFLIYDSTVLGGCTRGFAICTSGIYFNDGRQGFWNWSDFSKQKIQRNALNIIISGLRFSTSTDTSSLATVLYMIQDIC